MERLDWERGSLKTGILRYVQEGNVFSCILQSHTGTRQRIENSGGCRVRTPLSPYVEHPLLRKILNPPLRNDVHFVDQ